MSISSFAQETMCYIDQQVYREYDQDKSAELHYVSVDGAMYLTREESWKESKLGRIYQPKDIVQVNPKRSELVNPTYVTHLGDNKEFVKKMDYHLENLNNLVFIADGARWIWKWIDELSETMLSGAIESAHKDVLQQRLKLSGQRWTISGFQQIAQLRVVYKSKQEHRIKKLCRMVA